MLVSTSGWGGQPGTEDDDEGADGQRRERPQPPQLDAALRTLELAPLTSKSRAAWVVRLRYAYADALEAAGRESDALALFHRTHAIDSDELTDSAERAELLERRQP